MTADGGKLIFYCIFVTKLTDEVINLIWQNSWAWRDSTYVVTSEDGQVEGQQLQRDDAQDALQAVHTVRHFDIAAGVLDSLVIVFVTDHDRAALQVKQSQLSFSVILIANLKTTCFFPSFLSWSSHLLNTSAEDYQQGWCHAALTPPLYLLEWRIRGVAQIELWKLT